MIDALIEWTRVKHRLNDYDGVLPRLERAVALARARGDQRRLGNALSWTANTHFVMGFPSRAVPYLVETQDIGRSLDNEQMVLLPLFFGTWAVVDRDPAAAVGQIQEVVELARKNGVTDELGHAIASRAVALARIGDFAAAHQQVEEALAQLSQTPSPVNRADIHIAVGMALHDMGELEASLKHARLGAELAEGAHGMECACAGYLGVGRVQVERNEIADARDKFERSLKYADMAGFEQFRNVIEGGVAFTQFELGSEAAIEGMRLAIANARSGNDGYAEATMSEKLATALLRLGRRDEAGEAIGAALNYYRTAGMRPFLANALGVAGRVYDQNGQAKQAAAARTEAAAIAASLKGLADPPAAGA
jgi:tetratricopeptide (TPR) repeat protein